MMLLIMDKNPVEASSKVPDRLKFKQLIELGQLICSARISNVYKEIPQGKELQAWVLKNPWWVECYFEELFKWCLTNINMENETKNRLQGIHQDLVAYYDLCASIPLFSNITYNIETAIFRYSKGYKSIFPSNTELQIENACEEYKKYMEWKELKHANK